LFIKLMSVWWLFFTGCTPEKQNPEPVKTGPGFFSVVESDSILDIGIVFNMEELMQHREDEGKISAVLEIGNQWSFPARISSRGITRKKICDFPPLHLYLPDSICRKMGWGPYRKYKLVTHCNLDPGYQEVLFREYLTYQLYHELTPIALRAQLCRIGYQTEADTSLQYAFLLEDDDEMASRVGGNLMKDDAGNISQIHKVQYQNLVMFQYMIGNTDWNLGRRHNMMFVKVDSVPYPMPVPYDFDYSGLVNAPYAVPHPSLPIKNVRERFWQYRGKETDDFKGSIDLFLSKKDDFIQTISQFNLMTDASKQSLIQYIESFYDELEQPGAFQKIMTGNKLLEK
jgi:hypothetical protein